MQPVKAGSTFDPAALSGAEARALIRAGRWRRPTSGLAAGWAQANLVILPHSAAGDFLRFCHLNPRPCPLLDVGEPGSPSPRAIASDADVRTDLGRYRIYRKGALTEEVTDLRSLWQPDFVAFFLGCSFTFEAALGRAGITLRHVELGRNVSMFKTNVACQPARPFHGPLVVSMRPVPDALVQTAIDVTTRFQTSHGAPIHVGDASALGIEDLTKPDYGDSVPILVGETPVFWACGVTPQAAAEEAAVELMITHAPGHMFISDLREENL
jgi:uncharacterized protein YcsI (UPF0317 family)